MKDDEGLGGLLQKVRSLRIDLLLSGERISFGDKNFSLNYSEELIGMENYKYFAILSCNNFLSYNNLILILVSKSKTIPFLVVFEFFPHRPLKMDFAVQEDISLVRIYIYCIIYT